MQRTESTEKRTWPATPSLSLSIGTKTKYEVRNDDLTFEEAPFFYSFKIAGVSFNVDKEEWARFKDLVTAALANPQ